MSEPTEDVAATSTATRRALIVEDAPDVRELVRSVLRKEGFVTETAVDGESAVALARSSDPNVIVLDLSLPGMDGIEVCRQIRTFSDAYIVMLTARDAEVDKLVGLSVGADDYLTKPFSPRELVARIGAMLRRPRQSGGSDRLRTFGELEIDPLARQVTLAGKEIELTRIEFDLLDSLSERPRVALSRQQLLDSVWGPSWFGDDHVVDVHISNLRRKIEPDASRPTYVQTVRGVGYRMDG